MRMVSYLKKNFILAYLLKTSKITKLRFLAIQFSKKLEKKYKQDKLEDSLKKSIKKRKGNSSKSPEIKWIFFLFSVLGVVFLFVQFAYSENLVDQVSDQVSSGNLDRPLYWKYLEALNEESSEVDKRIERGAERRESRRAERRFSIQRLSKYPYPEVVLALMNSLEDRDEIARFYAKRSLLNLGKFTVPYLKKGLESKSSWIRLYSAEILGEMGEKQFFPDLIRMLLSDKMWKVRKSSAYALGLLEDPRAGDSLIQALKDSEPFVRAETARALRKIPATPSIVKSLCATLGDKNSYVRLRSAGSLGYIRKKEAVPCLLVTLQDGNMEIREISAWALGKIRDPRAIPSLMKTLRQDQSALVRQSARSALKKIGVELE